MKKIVLSGEGKAGKSLLTYALGKYCNKNALASQSVNLDPTVRHLKHLPFFDIRKSFPTSNYPGLTSEDAKAKILSEVNYHALDKELNRAKCDLLFIDSAFSYEDLLLKKLELSQYVDCILLLSTADKVKGERDELCLKALGAVATFKQEVPCITVVNKSDLAGRKRPRISFSYSSNALQEFEAEPLVYASALEKTGFKEILAAIEGLEKA